MVAGFHAVSAAISLEAQKYGADPKKITIIPPAVKSALTEKWAVEKSTQIDDELKIISVGRCHWKKGYTYALDAMALLKKKDVQFHYTIIAGGRDQENILYQIHDLGLNECVSFINDKLSHDEVLKKVSECDLFLLPSLEEGISNAVLEAMALGIPVISTDCGGMGEVIRNSENGFLVQVRDSESMAEKIEYISYLEKSEIKTIINNAKETLKNNYLLKDQVDSFKLFYKMIKNKNIMYKGANNVYR
jgi:colanic acid/amylovoran biosynthesis glycosyltransferase